MKLSKNKVIGSILLIAVLVFSFWYGGNAPGLQGFNTETKQQIVSKVNSDNSADAEKTAEKELNSSDVSKEEEQKPQTDGETQDKAENPLKEVSKPKTKTDSKEQTSEVKENKNVKTAFQKAETTEKSSKEIDSRPGGTKGALTAQEKLDLAKELAGNSSASVKKGDTKYSKSKGMVLDTKTGKDKYLTDPVPEGKPIPVEPQNVVVTDKELTCTLSVRCDTILDNIDWLDKEKVELVPKDGVIFAKQTVTFYEGESVFNVLLREMKKNKIHMEFVNTPMYNSAYIEGINNLYEFDCGELSGWMYKVNDWFPNYGCSRYQIKQGDTVEWVYTCNLGIDVGGYYALGGD